ncbi:unnamed protein product [Calicophoron daubneyi]|uniref:V-type proton ATPase subunit G n=1 Tax=Calicophoron daubneyi TaxID=300641 RepID=A0AAV2TNH7_CALDB
MPKVDGVAQLQTARTAALEKVNEARTRKIKRLQQAKVEANSEMELYKKELEAHCQALQAEVESSKGGMEESSRVLTEEYLRRITESYKSNKEAALELLLSSILDIKPQVNANFSGGNTNGNMSTSF